jgi:hypothetical protein
LFVVVLLEAILSDPIGVDKAEEVTGERGSNAATRLRIQANSNLFKGYPADSTCRDLASDDFRLGVIKRREEHSPLATSLKRSANLARASRVQCKRCDECVGR